MRDPRVRLAAAATDADRGAILDALARPQIHIVLPPHPLPHHVTGAATLYALACRLFPNTVPISTNAPLQPNPWGASDLATAMEVQPHAPDHSHPTPRAITVALGAVDTPADYFVDGDDWTAYVSNSAPTPGFTTPSQGGLGLQAAAALAIGEILKSALAELGLRTNQLDGTLTWNLLDYELRARRGPPPGPRHPSPLLFAGAGSLGSSAIAALTFTPLAANLDVVDDDRFDPVHNAFRYPAATRTTRGPKTDWIRDFAVGANLSVTAHPKRILDWSRDRVSPGFDGTAVVTVDRVDARLDAASILPRETIAAGVSGLSLQVHRAVATDYESACSYCLYVDAARPHDQVDTYADLTGISSARILQLLDGQLLSRDDLSRFPERVDLIGRRLEDLVREAYAEATITLDGPAPVAEVTAPQVSWLAGVLIAAELLKHALSYPALNRRLRVDMRGLPLGVTDRPPADPTGRCICHSSVRRTAAASWY